MSRTLAGSLGIMVACLMAGLLGVIAITGRWPVDAPRTHMEARGILSLPVERVARIEFSTRGQHAVFNRNPPEGWLFNGIPTGPAVAGHIDMAVRLLTVSAPRRVLTASEFSPDQLSEYGLDPPRFVLAIADNGGDTTRVSFGEATPAQNAQYVGIVGRPELYLLPRDVGEEWQLARDMGERNGKLLLPISITQIWAIEIVSRGTLYRFERDPAGLWFRHIGQHVHLPGGFVHHADLSLATLIEAELTGLERLPIARIVARHPDAAGLAGAGLEHPATILLLYSRDNAGPVARIELGNPSVDGLGSYALIQQSDALAIVPDDCRAASGNSAAARRYAIMMAILLVALTSLLSCANAARAHQVNLMTARLEVLLDRTVDVEIAIKGSDIDRAAGTRVFDDSTNLVRPAALAAASEPILRYVERHTTVFGEGNVPCRPGSGDVAADGDGVVVRIPWSCTGVSDPLRYRSTVVADVSPAARQVVLIGAGPNAAQDLLDAGQTETALTATPPPSLPQVIGRYTVAGIEHIFLGYDHIAFLAAIVLWAQRLWPVVKVVTAFTVAHSITLSLAALEIVRIPSSIIEPAIAVSIVYVAAENFLSRDIDKRWRDTFGFGLIHGFGFASALQEFGLPRSALVPALASFNLGVEIGQIAIVSLIVPALLGMDRMFANGRRAAEPPIRPALAVYAISAAIIGLGSYWFVARTVLSA